VSDNGPFLILLLVVFVSFSDQSEKDFIDPVKEPAFGFIGLPYSFFGFQFHWLLFLHYVLSLAYFGFNLLSLTQ
jgi:hypothetical protein